MLPRLPARESVHGPRLQALRRPARGSGSTSPALCSWRVPQGCLRPGRLAKSKIMPMLLLAAILPAGLHHRGRRGRDPTTTSCRATTTSYVLNLQVVIAIYRRLPGTGDRVARPALPRRVAVLLATARAHRLRAGEVRRPDGRAVRAHGAAADDPVRRRTAGRSCRSGAGARLPARRWPARCCSPWCSRASAWSIAAFTPRRGLGVAAIIAVLLVLAGVQGAVQAIAVEECADTFAGYAGLVSPFTLVHGVQDSAARRRGSSCTAEPPGTLGGRCSSLLTIAARRGLLRRPAAPLPEGVASSDLARPRSTCPAGTATSSRSTTSR